MKLDTITMDPAGAEELADEYGALREPTDEEQAIAAGYLALAAGKTLINLRNVLAAGGEHDDGTPCLAVMDATRDWCYVARTKRGTVIYSAHQSLDGRTTRGVYRYPELLPPRADLAWELEGTWAMRLRAMVPVIPPRYRRWGSRWRKCAILWEVDRWETAPAPPGDPALIRQLHGDLWTVEATWDLTDLERAVLAGRNQA